MQTNPYIRLFKVASYLTLLLVLSPVMSVAQDNKADSLADFDMLITPTTPGFALLDKAPNSIQRPSSLTDLSFTFLQETDALSELPDNFALEVAPYWLFSHPSLTYETYEGAQNVFEDLNVLLQTLAISVATTSETVKNKAGEDSTTTKLAWGARLSLARGKVVEEFQGKINTLNDLFGTFLQAALAKDPLSIHLDTTITNELDQVTQAADDNSKVDSLMALVDSLTAMKTIRTIELSDSISISPGLADEKKKVKTAIGKLKYKRVGFMFDVAGAMVYDFPDRIYEDGERSRWGVWATAGYETKAFSLLGLVRYVGRSTGLDSSNVDVGARLTWDPKSRFSLSLEGIRRTIIEEAKDVEDSISNSTRWAFTLDYKVAKNKTLSFTVGRNFDGTPSGNVIAAANLVLGFGSTRRIK